MSRPTRLGEKPRQFSLRIPEEYAAEIDRLKEIEGTDSTVIILRAVKFWLETGGKATTDYDLLGRMTALETELKNLRESDEKRFAEYQKELEEKNKQIEELIASQKGLQRAFEKQQNTIEKLVELIGKINIVTAENRRMRPGFA